MAELAFTTVPADLVYTRNPVEVELATEFTDSYVLLKVYDGYDNVVATLDAYPNASKVVSFDIAEVLDAKVSWHPPSLAEDNVLHDIAFGYYLQGEEYKNGSLETSSIPQTSTKYAIKGGLSQEKTGYNIFGKIATDKMFLTWATHATVRPDQPYWLYFLNLDGTEPPANKQAKYKVYYADGSTSPVQTLPALAAAYQYDAISIACGFKQAGMDAISAKTALRYEVWIENIDIATIVAGKFTFYLTDIYCRYPVNFIYANSLGGFEGLHASGRISQETQGDFEEIEVFNSSGSQLSTAYDRHVRDWEAMTGSKEKEEIDRMTDIFNTNKMYEILGTDLIPLARDKKMKTGYAKDDNRFIAELKYKRAYINRNYTPDVIS